MIQMLHLKTVHNSLNARQKLLDEANLIFIALPMYNLTYWLDIDIDNYSNTSGSLWQSERDEIPPDDTNLNIDNFQSFKYKVTL